MRPSDCKEQPLPFKLYVITDRKLFPDRESMLLHFKKLALGLKPGTLAVQVREKDLNLAELLDLTVRIHEAIFPSKIFVNSRWDVALAANADGVHLAESADGPACVANNYPKMIGVSCHSLERLHSLAGIANDNRVFATFSPIFETPSKLAYGAPQGISKLCQAVRESPVPIVALGGIDFDTAPLLKDCKIGGIAVIRAILEVEDPVYAANKLLELAGLT